MIYSSFLLRFTSKLLITGCAADKGKFVIAIYLNLIDPIVRLVV